MTDRNAIDGMLRSWFTEDAVRTAPTRLAATVAEATRGRRQQPGWLAWLTGDRISAGGGSRRRTGALLLAVTLLAGTLLALVAGGFLAAGGSPVTPPSSRIYTSATPWSFDQPPDVCTARTGTILPDGPLPRVGPPAIEHPRNGMIAGSSDPGRPGNGRGHHHPPARRVVDLREADGPRTAAGWPSGGVAIQGRANRRVATSTSCRRTGRTSRTSPAIRAMTRRSTWRGHRTRSGWPSRDGWTWERTAWEGSRSMPWRSVPTARSSTPADSGRAMRRQSSRWAGAAAAPSRGPTTRRMTQIWGCSSCDRARANRMRSTSAA